MHRVHREATERVGANRLGRNGMRFFFFWEGLDGTGMERGLAYRTTEETDLLRSERVLLIGRGVAYRKTEETDLLWSKRGSC